MAKNDTLFMTAMAKKSHTFWAEYTQNSALMQYLSNAIWLSRRWFLCYEIMLRVALAPDTVNTSTRDEYRFNFKIALVNTLKVIFLITIQRYLHSLIAVEFDNFL